MAMRVNDVIITSAAGMNVSSVSRTTICSGADTAPTPSICTRAGSAARLAAAAGAAAARGAWTRGDRGDASSGGSATTTSAARRARS